MRPSRINRRPTAHWLAVLPLLVGLFGCSIGSGIGASPSPGPESSGGCGSVPLAATGNAGLVAQMLTACATPGPAATAGQLRLRLIDQLGPRWYCDPDEYPIAHGTELAGHSLGLDRRTARHLSAGRREDQRLAIVL